MSVFLLWWTLGNSLCSAIAATIATGSLATRSLKFLPIVIVFYWISLGIVEWILLSPYLSGAYQWGLLTMIGGIVGSGLLVFAARSIFMFLFRGFSSVLGGTSPTPNDFLIALVTSILCLFTTGLFLGFGQNLILQNSLSQIYNGLPILTALTWLIGFCSYIAFLFLGKYHPFKYIILVTFSGLIFSFFKGLILEKVLNITVNLPANLLLEKELIKIAIFSLIIALFFYLFRYPILQALGFTRILYGAIWEGKINAEDFLSHGGNPNIKVDDYALLHGAVLGGNLALIKLLNHRADVDARDFRGDTPLLNARVNKKEVIQLLIENGADINAQNDDGFSILHTTNDKEIVELLIKNGANPNLKNKKEQMPLHLIESVEYAEVLIVNGADINGRDSIGYTPLHIASHKGNLEIVKLLLKHGADANAKDNFWKVPLHLARNLEIVQLLIDRGANVKIKDDKGMTPLHNIVQYSGDSYTKIASLLLDRGADVNAKDDFGRTPLHLTNNLEGAKLLIDRGANVNAKDNEDKTPLHNIVRHSGSPYTEIASLLLDRGADVNVKNNKGKTPLDIAYENNKNGSNKGTIMLLKFYGGALSK